MANSENMLDHINFLQGQILAQNSILLSMMRAIDPGRLPVLDSRLHEELAHTTNALLHSDNPDEIQPVYAEHLRIFRLAVRERAQKMGVPME